MAHYSRRTPINLPFRNHQATASRSCRPLLPALLLSLWFGTLGAALPSAAGPRPAVDLKEWGALTAPVFGTSESGVYAGAELFAGPDKCGAYFSGVLPNGRIVKPAGVSIQVGMNPLGLVLTPDGKFLISSNDDERREGVSSYENPANAGGYSLSVVDTASMRVVSRISAGRLFMGLQVSGTGPYTLWASGGGDNDVKLFDIGTDGVISRSRTTPSIPLAPISPNNQGFVSHYDPDPVSLAGKPLPSGFDPREGAHLTFPAGSALSPDGRFLYVALMGDNSVAAINTARKQVVQQVPVGYFPYDVAVAAGGRKILVSNWGITAYKFAKPTYDPRTGKLTALISTGNLPAGFFVPVTRVAGPHPRTSSISILTAAGGDGSQLALSGSIYEGQRLDALEKVGDTHPSATAVVARRGREILYVTKSNVDRLGVISLQENRKLPDLSLSPLQTSGPLRHDYFRGAGRRPLYGGYPNAMAVSPDNQRMYVAEAGINAVAVLSLKNPLKPELLGRLPTGWYPTALALSGDGRHLYIANAKGVGEDLNPLIKKIPGGPGAQPTGLVSDPQVDSNFMFGTLQKVDLNKAPLSGVQVLNNNSSRHEGADTGIVPLGGGPSPKITHVFFILHENKTFDSLLGSDAEHFGPFAGLVYNRRDGAPYTNPQYTGVAPNTQMLARRFACAVNYYSDSEESDAGHQFAAAGTATDYTEKTLLVKSGRGLMVNKNFEPEDYPAGGYIFNNCARNGVSFKDYGALVRLDGTDTGGSPTAIDDPGHGEVGYPRVDKGQVSSPLRNSGDVDSPTAGLGQSYFLDLPVLAVLGGRNPGGEPRLDRDYPGYNFNISDQRRALEFIRDFDRMVAQGRLPQFLYVYQPNDHTGQVQAPNAAAVITEGPMQQVADGDVALGMVVRHIMESPVYYQPATGEGSAIFITWDDAQATLDHIHPHRTPLIVVSPYARPGYVARRHYCTASIVKTEELLLGLPPMNLGDLFATDLRDLFQPGYNGITAAGVPLTRTVPYRPSAAGLRIWSLVRQLDTSGPDRDSARLGTLARLSARADALYWAAAKSGGLASPAYQGIQNDLWERAQELVNHR